MARIVGDVALTPRALVADDGSVATPAEADHQVVFVVYNGIQALDLTGPWEVFHGANALLARRPSGRPYRLTLCSTDGRSIETESGLQLATTALSDGLAPNTLIIPGGFGARDAAQDPCLLAWVGQLADRADRLVTICTGVYVAAAAGLCDGRRMATHWARARDIQRRYPNVQIDVEPIYVRDGTLWSSAGVTAGIDLALALVEEDHSAELAQMVARWLVMFLRRPGGQTQFATAVWTDRARYQPIRAAQDLVDSQPEADHRIGVLAAKVGMSERHFIRCFADQIGVSPAQYVAGVRVEAARRELETTDHTVETIAQRCGFGTAETMRRTFARRLGVPPDQYRQRFRTAVPTNANATNANANFNRSTP